MSVRLSAQWDRLRRSFWLWPALSMIAAVVLGWAIGSLDDTIQLRLGVVSFSDPSSARELLQTIATVTVTVIGISFSVTVVALQLASQQLGPRVLRTFQADALNKFVLSLFLGLFVYCIVVLMTLDSGANGNVPELAMAVAIALAIAAFGSFVAFIHGIVESLQAATLIRRIATDGARALSTPFPSGVGSEPAEPAEAQLAVDRRSSGESQAVRATCGGFVTTIDGERLMRLAAEEDLLVRQRVAIGEFALTRTVLAELWGPSAVCDELPARVAETFALDSERTVVQDAGFPVRQLADVALRALSPSLNDPTTAETAMGTLADMLIGFAGVQPPSPIRVDSSGTPRFVACGVELDGLVRLGFDQVRIAAAPHPVVARRLMELLDQIDEARAAHGLASPEVRRQLDLLRSAVSGEIPIPRDAGPVGRRQGSPAR